MNKQYLLAMVILLFVISCKKENFNKMPVLEIENLSGESLSQNHVLISPRTLSNTLLAVEYQLNEDLVDSITYYGEVQGGNDRIDEFEISFTAGDYTEITAEEQVSIYKSIEDSVEYNMGERYENLQNAAIRVIDVEINNEATLANDLVFKVRLVSFAKAVNCGCVFTTALPWAIDDPDADCGFANIKIQWMLNNFCAGSSPLGRIKYDFKTYNYLGEFISGSNSIELDNSLTISELGNLRVIINNKYNAFKSSTSGRNNIVNYQIQANHPWFEEGDPNSYSLHGTYFKHKNGSIPF